MSVLLRLGGFVCGLGTGVGMYYACVVQRMQLLQGQTLERVVGMEKQLTAAASAR